MLILHCKLHKITHINCKLHLDWETSLYSFQESRKKSNYKRRSPHHNTKWSGIKLCKRSVFKESNVFRRRTWSKPFAWIMVTGYKKLTKGYDALSTIKIALLKVLSHRNNQWFLSGRNKINIDCRPFIY